MFKSEVICDKDDKRKLILLMKEVKEILDKYPYSLDYHEHTVTAMSRAKTSCNELQRNIEILYIGNNKF